MKYIIVIILIIIFFIIQCNLVIQAREPGERLKNASYNEAPGASIHSGISLPMPPLSISSGGGGPSKSHLLNHFVESLQNGRLIYNPSNEMIINKTEQINATITEKGSMGETIKISPIMEVYLKGSAFQIDPITDSRQFIASTGPTIWKWDIVPRKIGNQTLDLLAYVIVEISDNEERRALVKNKTIQVKINPSEIPAPIFLRSTPLGAEVSIDGVYKGKTPINISDLTIGRHEMKLKHSGYLDYETIILGKSTAYDLAYDLEPEPGPLSNPTVIAALVTALAMILAAIIAVIFKKEKNKKQN
jgi:hypothetical protein